MQNVLTKGWLPVALFLMQNILLKIVDVSKFIDPALLIYVIDVGNKTSNLTGSS